MSGSSNPFGHFVRERLQKRKKTIPLKGSLEDSGRYFKCWNCGFICDANRDKLGVGDGITQLDKPDIAMGGFGTGDKLSVTMIVDDMFTILENDPQGNPITHYEHNQYPVSIGGCPLCGCKNYR